MLLITIAHLLNVLLVFAMPIGLAVYLTHRFHSGWRLWWIGAGTFVLSQAGHIPFNWAASLVLNRTALVLWPAASQQLFNAVFLGLSAGLFEELFRYGMYRWWAKDARNWSQGLLTGAGHGGAEAILIVGLPVLLAFINMSLARLPAIQATLTQGQLQAVNAYWSAPWYADLMGAVERFFAIIFQIALSLLVLQTFTRRQPFWLWLAVLIHALSDFTALLAETHLGVYWTEAIVGLFAISGVIIIFALRQEEPAAHDEPDAGRPHPTIGPIPPDESPDKLDQTRYL